MSFSRRMALHRAALTTSSLLLGATLVGGLSARLGRSDRPVPEAQAGFLTRSDIAPPTSTLICLAAGLVVGLVVVWQYWNVIRPLRRLSEGLRRIADGGVKERLPLTGAAEVSQLAADFNNMADEIDSLRGDLERKALARSRELVRSECLASVGFLAAGIAHEINNPLNTITGYAELLLRRARQLPNPEVLTDLGQALEIIREEGFRCKTITDKLLSLVRTGVGSRQAVSLARVAQDVLATVQSFAQFRDRHLRLVVGTDDPLTVWGNESELKQVVLNLVVNALEAVPQGTGQVVLHGTCRNGRVELSIADNGRGMTPEALEHAFEPFFSDRRPDGERGIGLGLSIAHAIIEAHGGHVTAQTDGPGRGSRFTVHLPAFPNSHVENGRTA
jgi:two-component system, NtrC family, sensor kinase